MLAFDDVVLEMTGSKWVQMYRANLVAQAKIRANAEQALQESNMVRYQQHNVRYTRTKAEERMLLRVLQATNCDVDTQCALRSAAEDTAKAMLGGK